MTIFHAGRLIVFGLVAFSVLQQPVHGQRAFVSEVHAWDDPSMLMAVGKVASATYPRTPGEEAHYDLEISEWLKPRNAGLPSRITIAEIWGATDTAFFRVGTEVMVFLRKRGEYYRSAREVELGTPDGRQALQATRLFLGIMYLPDLAQRRKASKEAWNGSLSDREKESALNAMWETRTPEYSTILRKIALGNDSPRVRGWALTILTSIGNPEGMEELIPILLSDADCEVKRQLLIALGQYRIQEALAAIEEFQAADQAARCPSWRAEDLRNYARQARDKITGKDPGRGWK